MTDQHPNTRILIVDDDEDDFIITSEYIRHIPGNTYAIDWCYRYDQALQHMINRDYHMYLVDYRMGAKSGVDLLKEALQHHCTEPIILLTGKGNYKVDIEAMQLGATDYLIKPELTLEKMERSIRYALDRATTLKALRNNEKKYRSIFERSKDLVFITNKMLQFRDINFAATALLEYSREELLTMSIYDIIEQQQSKEQLQETLLEKQEIDDWEVTLLTKSGEKKSCLITASFEDDRDESMVQGIIHDITNLKKAEKASLQAEKLAAAGRLVRTLAHEVRNPLNNIMLSVEQLSQEPMDESQTLYMDIIHRNSKRISDLISELLNTSRPTEITLADEHLQGILDDVISTTIDRLTLKHIGLKVDYPESVVWIKADAVKLKLALQNIVINAVEAMDEHKGKLQIVLKLQNNMPVLQIIDNGCGISEDNIARLFEPYFTQKRNGVGLGLAFTLNIIQAHKANIEVTSAVGSGTTFTISFPEY